MSLGMELPLAGFLASPPLVVGAVVVLSTAVGALALWIDQLYAARRAVFAIEGGVLGQDVKRPVLTFAWRVLWRAALVGYSAWRASDGPAFVKIHEFVAGAVLLSECVFVMRSVHGVIAQFLHGSPEASGSIRYGRRGVLLLSAGELICFAVFFAALAWLFQSAFFSGGAALCGGYALIEAHGAAGAGVGGPGASRSDDRASA
jgi:hypothetical protein